MTHLIKRPAIIAGALTLTTLITACTNQPEPQVNYPIKAATVAQKLAAIPIKNAEGWLTADIRRTSHGVPHIVANDWQSLGYGAGYAFSEDNACLVADQIIRVRGQRAQLMGPDSPDNAGDQANVINDLAMQVLGYYQNAGKHFDQLSEPVQAIFKGYASGYNQVVADRANPWPQNCMAGEISSITAVDLFAYQLFFAGNGSGAYVMPYLAAAQPPNATTSALITAKEGEDLLAKMSMATTSSMLGSNAWAVGKNRSATGKGALLANPHFPDSGNLRFYQQQLTIPGYLNVTGASVALFPVVNIGFNQNIAWTHTVSYAPRFTLNQLQLDEKDPTRYLFDGEYIAMEKKTFEVAVLNGPTIKRDFYYSKFGPMLSLPGTPLEWSQTSAVSFADVNRFNPDLVQHWLEMNLSDNAEEFKKTFKRQHGTPWVNTLYSDANGEALYIDGSPVPNLSQDVIAEVLGNPAYLGFYQQMGMLLMPGTHTRHLWQAQREPVIANENAPQLQNQDYLVNANGSPWLPTQQQMIEGFSPLYGEQKERMSLRTRYNFKLMDEVAGKDQLLSAKEMINAVMANKVYLAELILPDLISLCVKHADKTIDLAGKNNITLKQGCEALQQWDGTMNLNSRGGHLFREFAHRFDATTMFANPFDINDPVNTPNTLVSEGEPVTTVIDALVESVRIVAQSGIPLDARLADIQFIELHNYAGQKVTRMPFHGTTHMAGGFNLMEKDLAGLGDGTLFPRTHYEQLSMTGLSKEGYLIQHGSSWLMAVEFTEQGPQAVGLNIFSQSDDADSPYFADQQALFAAKEVRPLLFNEKDIVADKAFRQYRVKYPTTAFSHNQ